MTVTLSFDNLGEVADLARGLWPDDAQRGRHFSVTRSLPRMRALLTDARVRATFFVEGLNFELYPDTLRELAAEGHEIGYHGWCHESWADLAPAQEAELLARGRRAGDALGVELRGFRPPGGRLTASTLTLLAEHGFTHCSPAGRGAGVREGIAVLPFRWDLVDAYHYLPRFAELRGSPDPLAPAALAAALRQARDPHVSALFHPFLLEDDDRFDVLRGFVAELDPAVCAPYADVRVTGDDLELDLRIA